VHYTSTASTHKLDDSLTHKLRPQLLHKHVLSTSTATRQTLHV